MNKRSYQKEIVSRLEDIAGKFSVSKIGDVTFRRKELEYPLYNVVAESPNNYAPSVFFSAGVHGDEPAAVYALLEFLEKEVYNYLSDFSFVAFPCLNPSGFELDTRENLNKTDLNRHMKSTTSVQEDKLLIRFLAKNPRRYLFSVDVHEDPTDKPGGDFDIRKNPRKFYLYESSPTRRLKRGHKILLELKKLNIPICKRKEIYGDKNENGLIWTPKVHNPDYATEKSIQNYMQKYTSHSFTSETPTCWPLEKCIEVHLKMLSVALEEFRE